MWAITTREPAAAGRFNRRSRDTPGWIQPEMPLNVIIGGAVFTQGKR
jgi:hypothetical protein